MKVINALRRLNRYFAFGIIGLLIISFVTASTIIQVVSGPCTGTTNISTTDYTFTGSCTGTITRTIPDSTTTTTTTIAIPGLEQLVHIYGSEGCKPIFIISTVVHFDSMPKANDSWQSLTYGIDSIHNYTEIAGFTQIPPMMDSNTGEIYTHQFIESFYHNNVRLQNFILPIENSTLVSGAPTVDQPLISPFAHYQFLTTYMDDDSSHLIWYGHNTTNIQFEYNTPAYPVTDFSPTETIVAISGVNPHSITFTDINADVQIGNQFQQPQKPQEIPLAASYISACANFNPIILGNANEFIGQIKNNNTMWTETIHQ